MHRIFLLSPAHSGGLRAKMLLRPGATFELARQVQIGDALLGDVFSFCSGLYFRGKLGYARKFAKPPAGCAGVHVISPSRGLVSWDTPVGISDLEEFGRVPVDCDEPRYTSPLCATATAIAASGDCEAVLLGSIATGKYVDCLLPIFGSRLLFPSEFVGRGDMSRGALMMRHMRGGIELDYIPVQGAIRSGRRAPRIAQRPVLAPLQSEKPGRRVDQKPRLRS